MSRIANTFNALRDSGRTAFIPYLMAGDPAPELTVSLMHALVEGGADVLELGFPFSDPTADGPVIQQAGERALAAGITLKQVLALCTEFRQTNTTTPIILMGYANPALQFGYAAFADALANAGVDGVIIVDLPPEEEGELVPLLTAQGIAMIRLVAPTTQGERLEQLLSTAGGFVYTISIKGITGTASADQAALHARLEELRRYTTLPVVAGFGIKTPQDAAALHGVADGVVVGSALVDALHQAHTTGQDVVETARAFTAQMTAALSS